MSKKSFIFLFALLFSLLFLIACGGQEAAQEGAPENTPLPETPPTEPAAPPADPTPEPTEPAQAEEAYPEPEAPVVAQVEEEAYPAAPEPVPPPMVEAYPAPGDGSARTFVIVSEESEAAYSVGEEFFNNAVQQLGKALGFTETVGRTDAIEGEFQIDLTAENPLVAGSFTVDISALTSDDSRRDNRIRREWLESSRYPLATFVATEVANFPANVNEGESVSFQLLGEMTIREITQPVTFDVEAVLEGNSIRGAATAEMRMTDFGFDPPSIAGLFNVENEFTVIVTFTARES